jgi:1-acyl-sn-glycerol-3-phosphate acyltransferase
VLDGERPETDPSPVVPIRRRRRSRRAESGNGASPVDERLGSLEREVEQALEGVDEQSRATQALWMSVDGVLSTYATVRRWLGRDFAVGGGQPVGALSLLALYRYWWRVETIGLERIPAEGPVLLVANRAGTLLPYDAFMVSVATAMDHPSGRRTRPFIDEWLTGLPIVGSALASLGAQPATTARLRRTFEADEAAIVFPEGREAFAKPFAQRYRLARFGRTALLRLAVEMRVPIVPVAVIGSEEVHPVLWRLERLGRPLGLPAIPITPTLLPLPTKWMLHVGAPLEIAARPAARGDVRLVRTQVRARLQGLVSEALGRRRGVFFA